MNLNFDFNGLTRLKNWWRIVKENFETIQTAHNDLNTVVTAEKEKLSTEITHRTNADAALSNRINAEANTRSGADTALGTSINNEVAARQSADTTLQQNINAEASARQTEDSALRQAITAEEGTRESADNALSERTETLEGKAHTHPNAEVLDGITADDVENWNGIKEQVTQKQLDAAIAYFEEIGFSLSAQFTMLLTALGVVVYNGGWFGEEQDGVSLDGGAFEDENLELFDCGGFEPLSIGITTNAVTDGGTY